MSHVQPHGGATPTQPGGGSTKIEQYDFPKLGGVLVVVVVPGEGVSAVFVPKPA